MYWYIISKTVVYLTWEKKHECLLMPAAMSESTAPFVARAHNPTNQQALVFHYLSRQVRRTCVMRRGFKLDWTQVAASVHSSPIGKTGHHGVLGSWEQTFHVDMWETSQGRLIPFSGKAFLLVSRIWVVGAAVIETHQPYVDTLLLLPYGNLFFVVVRTSKWRRSIWLDFMTHFSKFAGGNFKCLVKTCFPACRTTPLSLISHVDIKEHWLQCCYRVERTCMFLDGWEPWIHKLIWNKN